jgi:hypothetical protein
MKWRRQLWNLVTSLGIPPSIQTVRFARDKLCSVQPGWSSFFRLTSGDLILLEAFKSDKRLSLVGNVLMTVSVAAPRVAVSIAVFTSANLVQTFTDTLADDIGFSH